VVLRQGKGEGGLEDFSIRFCWLKISKKAKKIKTILKIVLSKNIVL
jgi:hypothetical protein